MVQKSQKKKCKYIFVTGGVLSGVGKGITAASMGAILKAKGYKVTMQKCDPYLNVDAGLLNPVEHGECYVTHDGVETDLDLGHYERFLDFETSRYSITLSGSIYKELIERERAGGFHGKTVQLVPHFTGLVMEKIEKASADSDVHIVEIGGTVGDYEGLPFIEAIRLFANKVGRRNCLYLSVVYVPWINTSKELKTKPAQNALKDLRGFGIIPDIVCVRTEKPCPRAICEKIAAFSGISGDAVVNLPDIGSVYDVPFNVLKSGVLEILNDFVGDDSEPDMSKWIEYSARRSTEYDKTVHVGLVAKYVGNEDTYICVTEALKAAAAWNEVNLDLKWINAEELTAERSASSEDALLAQRTSSTSRSGAPSSSQRISARELLESCDGVVVPGGFGLRGVEGKIAAADYCLENDKPYLGLCLGLQAACIAAARRGGLKGAGSEEFLGDEKFVKPRDFKNVIYIMEGQEGKESTGGTMRLGDYPATLDKGSKVAEFYRESFDNGGYIDGTKVLKDGRVKVVERHRHRYEVNQKFLKEIAKGGVEVSGTSPDGKLVEFIEAPELKFFVATQAHPEFKSRPLNVHPLFYQFIKSLK
ncbi:CTP synthase [Candidatus Saccharibacteria bacterium]|nr:CTP synthase [Candidatus Saccharibacteria bacterium]